jgi:hypothetical protein
MHIKHSIKCLLNIIEFLPTVGEEDKVEQDEDC